MIPAFKKYGQIIFALIGAFAIIAAAWWTKDTPNNDTWLYVFSVWMILFSAFEAYSSVKMPKVSKIMLATLTGAFVIILAAWWANGAENLWVFLTCVVVMLASFFVIASQKKKGEDQ